MQVLSLFLKMFICLGGVNFNPKRLILNVAFLFDLNSLDTLVASWVLITEGRLDFKSSELIFMGWLFLS